MLQVIPLFQGHEKAQNASDVVVLTITPGIAAAGVTQEIRRHRSDCAVIAVMGLAT